jgi:hypothetical protein
MGASSDVWWQHHISATDSLVEQSPEVEQTERHLTRQRGGVSNRDQRREGTRHGGWGNPVAARRLPGRGTLRRVFVRRLALWCLGTAGWKLANPMVGCRAQQTCRTCCGVSRRSREERQGRNIRGGWHLSVVTDFGQPGVDATCLCRRRGDSMNPMRGVRTTCAAFGRHVWRRPREPVCVF